MNEDHIERSGVEFEAINYYIDPIPRGDPRIAKKMNLRPREILRTRGEAFKQLNKNVELLSGQAIIDLLIGSPDLIQPRIIDQNSQRLSGRSAK